MPRKRRMGLNPETMLQIACADFLRIYTKTRPYMFWCHIPNGGKRTAIEGALFKRMGVQSGVPDLLIFWGNQPVWVELKVKTIKTKGRVSDNQRIFLEWATHQGHATRICYSVKELADFVHEFDEFYFSQQTQKE